MTTRGPSSTTAVQIGFHPIKLAHSLIHSDCLALSILIAFQSLLYASEAHMILSVI